LLGATYGDLGQGRSDLAYSLDVTTGSATQLLDAGTAFVLGDTLCAPGCTDCFLADARAQVLRTFRSDGAEIVARSDVKVDPGIGLPPRALGFLMAK
jgi:hypothetical protein